MESKVDAPVPGAEAKMGSSFFGTIHVPMSVQCPVDWPTPTPIRSGSTSITW